MYNVYILRLVVAVQTLLIQYSKTLALFDPSLFASMDHGIGVQHGPVDKQKNDHGIALTQKHFDAHHRDPERNDSFYGSYGWTSTYSEKGKRGHQEG